MREQNAQKKMIVLHIILVSAKKALVSNMDKAQ